jgi:hypothetical protein
MDITINNYATLNFTSDQLMSFKHDGTEYVEDDGENHANADYEENYEADECRDADPLLHGCCGPDCTNEACDDLEPEDARTDEEEAILSSLDEEEGEFIFQDCIESEFSGFVHGKPKKRVFKIIMKEMQLSHTTFPSTIVLELNHDNASELFLKLEELLDRADAKK